MLCLPGFLRLLRLELLRGPRGVTVHPTVDVVRGLSEPAVKTM